MTKFLLQSLYCGLIYGVISIARKKTTGKMSPRANYLSWYLLLLSLPLSYLGWNNWMKQPLFDLFFSERVGGFYRIVILTWCAALLYKRISLARRNHQIRQTIKRLTACPSAGHIIERAACDAGVHQKRIHVLVANEPLQSPVSYGVFRKVILLPHGYDRRYTESELYLLLVHEMVHIKNNDTVKLHFMNVAACYLWVLGPFIKRFKCDVEILCDNRVMGIQKAGRDTYGELLLKVCSGREAVSGVAFSDSYFMLKNRLNALYAYRPERKGIALFGSMVVVILLVVCLWLSIHPVSQLTINDTYNKEFEISLVYENSADGGIFTVPLGGLVALEEQVLFHNAYTVIDDQLRVDKSAFTGALDATECNALPIVGFMFDTGNYYMASSQNLMQFSTNVTYGFRVNDLSREGEQDDYFYLPLTKRSPGELLFLAAATFL